MTSVFGINKPDAHDRSSSSVYGILADAPDAHPLPPPPTRRFLHREKRQC